jgi:tetratricopeptide (TPR) repeat protein
MTDAPTTPDPIEIAMEAEASGVSPQGVAHRVLARQEQLLGWQVANERAALALRLVTGLAGLAALAVVAWFVWSASQARGLVVDAFATPPSLAADGLTGEVAATRLLDRLRDLETRSTTLRDQASFANSWGGDLKVDIPRAGVSLDQVQRWLRTALGRETRISGEIVRSGETVTLNVRAGAAAGVAFSGRAAEIDRLIALAADEIYRQTQPYRWGVLLYDADRFEEADAAWRALAAQGEPVERAWGYNGWGSNFNYAGRPREAIPKLRRAIEIDPNNPVAHLNLLSSLERLGHDGEMLAERRTASRLFGDRDSHGVTQAGRTGQRLMLEGQTSQALGDHTAARARFRTAVESPRFRQSGQLLALDAESAALAHEPAAARGLLDDMVLPPATSGVRRLIWISYLRATIAADIEAADWTRAAADVARARAFVAEQQKITAPFDDSLFRPMQALVEARSGDLAKAQATAATLPADCYRCQRVRGTVAAMAGDRAASRQAFAAARAIAPMLPMADLDEGRARLDQGDLKGAIASFTAANRLGPKWADPLAYWGEALLAQGDAKGADAKFAAAARLAPRWDRLNAKWREARARRDTQ